jgi:hypothetical protein
MDELIVDQDEIEGTEEMERLATGASSDSLSGLDGSTPEHRGRQE